MEHFWAKKRQLVTCKSGVLEYDMRVSEKEEKFFLYT
jgi:hypothetical protein